MGRVWQAGCYSESTCFLQWFKHNLLRENPPVPATALAFGYCSSLSELSDQRLSSIQITVSQIWFGKPFCSLDFTSLIRNWLSFDLWCGMQELDAFASKSLSARIVSFWMCCFCRPLVRKNRKRQSLQSCSFFCALVSVSMTLTFLEAFSVLWAGTVTLHLLYPEGTRMPMFVANDLICRSGVSTVLLCKICRGGRQKTHKRNIQNDSTSHPPSCFAHHKNIRTTHESMKASPFVLCSTEMSLTHRTRKDQEQHTVWLPCTKSSVFLLNHCGLRPPGEGYLLTSLRLHPCGFGSPKFCPFVLSLATNFNIWTTLKWTHLFMRCWNWVVSFDQRIPSVELKSSSWPSLRKGRNEMSGLLLSF